MEILKLTTLALLIAVGVPLSDAAIAYPEPVDQSGVSGKSGPGAKCSPTKTSQSELGAQFDRSSALTESVVSRIAPTSTSPLSQDRVAHVHICRLDLDLIETD